MIEREWFIRLYGEIIHELQQVAYRPKNADEPCSISNRTIFSVELVFYELHRAKDSRICGSECYWAHDVLCIVMCARVFSVVLGPVVQN